MTTSSDSSHQETQQLEEPCPSGYHLPTLKAELTQLCVDMEDKIVASQALHLLSDAEVSLLRQAESLVSTLASRLADDRVLEAIHQRDRPGKSGDVGLTCDRCINSALSLQDSHLPVTLAVVLGFIDRFPEYASDRCGFYQGSFCTEYKKRYVQEVRDALRSHSMRDLIEIVAQGKQITRYAVFETLYRSGEIILSGEEEVHLLTFLLECPTQLSDDDKQLVRDYDSALKAFLAANQGIASRSA